MSSNSFIGKQIGNYTVIADIASGGFGSVYQGKHLIFTDRPVVAIKLLHATYLGSTEAAESFIQEARFLERLKHPYSLSIIDAGIHEGIPYLVTEYAPNGSLRHRLKRILPHPMPLEEALPILAQTGQALYHAHQQDIIHRDLKPENILFNARGEALLADYGIAIVLQTSSMRQVDATGTPAYMAPEQFRGKISKESDQYSLGCIAYEVVTGRQPFSAPDFVAMGFLHATEAPLPPRQLNPDLPVHMEQAILTALAKQRSDRFPDVAAFLAALSVPAVSQTELAPTLPEEDIPTIASARTSLTAQRQAGETTQPGRLSPVASQLSSSLPPTQLASSSPTLPATSPILGGGRSAAEAIKTEVYREPRRPSPEQREKLNVWRIGKRQIGATVLGILIFSLYNALLIILFNAQFAHGANAYLNASVQNIAGDNYLYSRFFDPYHAFLYTFKFDSHVSNYFLVAPHQYAFHPEDILWGLLLTLPLLFGAKFGPWVGFFTGVVGGLIGGLFGNLILQFPNGSVFWNWSLGIGLIGFIAGFAFRVTQNRPLTLRTTILACVVGVLGIVVGCGFVFLSDSLLESAESLGDAVVVFLSLAPPCIILSLILLPILLVTSDAVNSAARVR